MLDADLAGQESREILNDIRALDGTIRARLVGTQPNLKEMTRPRHSFRAGLLSSGGNRLREPG